MSYLRALALKTSSYLHRLVAITASAMAVFILVLMLAIITQVALRYLFSASFPALEELQWHFYALCILFSLAYSQSNNSHIRVDIFYANYSQRKKAVIDIVGIVFFALPFALIVFLFGIDFVAESYRVGERSVSPAGLSYRWLIKSAIPVGFLMLIMILVSRLLALLVLVFSPEEEGPAKC